MNFLLVFIGGGLGSVCRFGISVWLKNHGYIFPMATFLANVVSCIILGVLVGWTMKNEATDFHKYLLMTGFCGGFSTFSTFTNETLQLFQMGQFFHAMVNILVSVVVCLGGIYLGVKMVS